MLTIRIVHVCGVKSGRDYVLAAEDTLLVGRDTACDVCLDDPLVSRRHASISDVFGDYFVEDFSVTGTFVNGERIDGFARLSDGDRIVVGGSEICISIRVGPAADTKRELGRRASNEYTDSLECRAAESVSSQPTISPENVERDIRRRWPTLFPKSASAAIASSLPPELLQPRPHRMIAPPADRPEGDEKYQVEEVECSVFAPPKAVQGSVFLVQMFAHTPAQTDEAERLARQFDDQSQRRGFATLDLPVRIGNKLTLHLVMPGLEILEPVQHIRWWERVGSVQFSVAVPDDFKPGVVIGTVRISRDGALLGHIKFKLEVTAATLTETNTPAPTGIEAKRYRKAFISYASTDRDEVLKRVQMLRQVGIDYFQDVLNLEPGTRWEKQLYRYIDEADLFLLFWSTAARQSKWVLEELRYAMKRKGTDELASPEIQPVVIEGPPPPLPPDELAHLHFNDYLLYFMGRGK